MHEALPEWAEVSNSTFKVAYPLKPESSLPAPCMHYHHRSTLERLVSSHCLLSSLGWTPLCLRRVVCWRKESAQSRYVWGQEGAGCYVKPQSRQPVRLVHALYIPGATASLEDLIVRCIRSYVVPAVQGYWHICVHRGLMVAIWCISWAQPCTFQRGTVHAIECIQQYSVFVGRLLHALHYSWLL